MTLLGSHWRCDVRWAADGWYARRHIEDGGDPSFDLLRLKGEIEARELSFPIMPTKGAWSSGVGHGGVHGYRSLPKGGLTRGGKQSNNATKKASKLGAQR